MPRSRLSLAEAPGHPHNAARGTFVRIDGVVQAAPAPRFGRTAASTPRGPVPAGHDTDALLQALGYDAGAITRLRDAGVVG